MRRHADDSLPLFPDLVPSPKVAAHPADAWAPLPPSPDWERLRARIQRSAFRRSFTLGEKDAAYAVRLGPEKVRDHALQFLRERLAPSFPPNDGRQTPTSGHPVFPAQHATGICCRKCLAKWHGIPASRPLAEAELNRLADILLHWIAEQ